MIFDSPISQGVLAKSTYMYASFLIMMKMNSVIIGIGATDEKKKSGNYEASVLDLIPD